MKTFVTKCPEAKSINVGCILNRSREGGGEGGRFVPEMWNSPHFFFLAHTK